jgi:hypothetical protein
MWVIMRINTWHVITWRGWVYLPGPPPQPPDWDVLVRVLFGLLYVGLTWRGLIPTFMAISKLNFKHAYLKLFLRTTSSDLCLRTQLAMSISP